MEIYDGHLELHALRAPIARDGYYADWTEGEVDWAVEDAVQAFEARFGVNVYRLGRSGRHVCIADTPSNRKRYPNLRRAAVAAARRLFASFKDGVRPSHHA